MNSLSLLVLIIFSSNSRGELVYDQYGYSEYGDGNPDISKDSNNARRVQPVGYTTSDSQMTTRPELSSEENDYAGEEGIPTRLEEDFRASDERFPATPSQLSKVPSFGVNSKITYAHSYYKNLRANETKRDQAPKRRDLTNWRESDGLFEINNYNPRGGSHEFYDDTPYLPEKYASQEDGKNPQYYQKNYYYNYYPQVNGRKFVAPSGPEIYDAEGGIRKTDVIGPYRFQKVNPCRQYLEFLRYAFQKLDRSADYQYDYNEYSDDWRDPELQRHQDFFGSRLYGPTLYIDNSGRAYQVNGRQDGLSVEDRIFPVSKDTILIGGGTNQYPTTPYYKDRTSEIDLQRMFGTTNFHNPNWNNIGYTNIGYSGFSTDTKPSEGYSTKAAIPTFEQSDEAKDYQKWWNTLRTESYSTRHTIPYNLEDSVAGETKEAFDDYNFSMRASPPTTTASPTYTTADYYNSLGNLREQPENTMPTVNSSVVYWTSPNTDSDKTTLPTTILSTSPPLNTFSSKTLIEVDTPKRDDTKETDCNDKMLPCPDTVNISYPLNGYCNRYVSCESGRAIRKTCPDGLHFNIIIKNCDIPHNSFCTYSCPEPDGLFGIPGDCSGYFVCKNSQPEYRMCPPRMHWDPQRSMCTFAELSRCPMKCHRANEVKHYEGDCKAYIVCLNNFPFYHKCPPNTIFDTRSLSCIPEQQSKCEDDPRLLTKTLNPGLLCRDIDVSVGTRSWCSYFMG